jgi:hypothetical protein
MYSTLDTNAGHVGTYYQRHGGRMGKAAVTLFNWKLKDDVKSKAEFCAPTLDSLLTKLGFKTATKNGMC